MVVGGCPIDRVCGVGWAGALACPYESTPTTPERRPFPGASGASAAGAGPPVDAGDAVGAGGATGWADAGDVGAGWGGVGAAAGADGAASWGAVAGAGAVAA
jgi:hypothetical protein